MDMIVSKGTAIISLTVHFEGCECTIKSPAEWTIVDVKFGVADILLAGVYDLYDDCT